MHLLYRKKWAIALGLLPALFFYIVFSIFPILNSFYYAFTNWDGLSEIQWVGLSNFKEILGDKVFWLSFKNNIYIVLVSIFGQVPIGLGLALLLNKKMRGSQFFRTVFFLPVVTSTVIVSMLWNMIYNYQMGLLNTVLRLVGLESWVRNWLGDPKTAMMYICIVIVWQFIGLYMVIFMAAIQNVPSEILEASELDGATGMKKTWYVIVPMIWDSILASIILCISGSLRTFDLNFVMTNGGPAHSTEVMAIYMFNKTFSSLQYGYGSAVSLLIFAFSLILIVITQLLSRLARR
ncbi:sugar ABC transporter permease [Paenibacillus frigoriresistens]|uniref:carbohydrate ABC transporter permease n=1 Tax=Paenibacillus alginolyticus TaxID=59839 RepID=UPI001566F095|nr:sugar ABC transporter permease [Paenibacillus frigoriresistens]NRF93584.1 sugar ABC transporter permease [Paenibacillus frigoriresistens]